MPRELQRLHAHRGFPLGNQLKCPIFTQDKFDYIRRIPSNSNNTIKVLLPLLKPFNPQVLQGLRDDDEGKGYFLKTPFTTNCENAKRCKDEKVNQLFSYNLYPLSVFS